MRIIQRYLTSDYLVAFLLTLLIFTFVMSVGAFIKAIDLIAKGVSTLLILRIFSFNIPYMLMFSIPISALTAVLLMFGRLSMDGELTAMRASGLSIWQIVSPVIMISILLSFFCLYLNSNLAPRSHYARRVKLTNLGIEKPVSLLDEGRFVRDFPNLMIYVGKKNGNKLKDIVVYEMDRLGVKRIVRAKDGEVREQTDSRILMVDLYTVRIDQPDRRNPLDPSQSRYISAEHYPVKLDFSEVFKKGKLKKRIADLTFRELVHAIRNVKEVFPELPDDEVMRERMVLIVEANERLALSIGCFAFTLLGIPLGMKSRRRESSVGVGISLVLVFIFYFFIIIAQSMVEHPQWRPDLIVWIPVIGCEVFGFMMLYRLN